jgi:hypothetical protein
MHKHAALAAACSAVPTIVSGATLFFDHRDPTMASAIGNRPIHD